MYRCRRTSRRIRPSCSFSSRNSAEKQVTAPHEGLFLAHPVGLPLVTPHRGPAEPSGLRETRAPPRTRSSTTLAATTVEIDGPDGHHLQRVRRLRAGEPRHRRRRRRERGGATRSSRGRARPAGARRRGATRGVEPEIVPRVALAVALTKAGIARHRCRPLHRARRRPRSLRCGPAGVSSVGTRPRPSGRVERMRVTAREAAAQ